MFVFGFIRGAILGVSLGLVSGLIAKKICKKYNPIIIDKSNVKLVSKRQKLINII